MAYKRAFSMRPALENAIRMKPQALNFKLARGTTMACKSTFSMRPAVYNAIHENPETSTGKRFEQNSKTLEACFCDQTLRANLEDP